MTKPSISETLQKMASEHESRSETARLRSIFPDVERALGNGVSRNAVLAVLQADGFKMSLKMFDKALYRIRKEQRQSEEPAKSNSSTMRNQTASSSGVVATTISELSSQPEVETVNPAVLKKIRNTPVDLKALSKQVRPNTA